jgi:predicted negative regulator of RcsB-dependent stress response
MKRFNQQGSLHLGVLLAVVVVAVVAFAGYRVWSSGQDKTTQTASTQSTGVPAEIKTKADLTQTSKALDQTGTELDATMNDATLDGDINSML